MKEKTGEGGHVSGVRWTEQSGFKRHKQGINLPLIISHGQFPLFYLTLATGLLVLKSSLSSFSVCLHSVAVHTDQRQHIVFMAGPEWVLSVIAPDFVHLKVFLWVHKVRALMVQLS